MEDKNKVGRPTDFQEKYIKQVYQLSLLGHTDKEIAKVLDVSESTLNTWKHKYPKFLESLKEGKDLADANVAASLYERACGYSHDEEKIFQYEGQIIRAETKKHYPPDTAAGFIWLKNRRSGKWRDRPIEEMEDGKNVTINYHFNGDKKDGKKS